MATRFNVFRWLWRTRLSGLSLAWCFLAFAASLPAGADPYELPPQVVTDVAPQIKPAPAAGRTEYTSEELKAMGLSSIEEALAAIPSLIVSPVGPSGAQSTVSLRGSTSTQVLVLVDGVRVSDPATGQVDLARLGLSLDDIESIEVVRGGVVAQYGADAVGGVVIIETRRGDSSADFSLKASNKAYLPAASLSGSGAGAVEVPASLLSLIDGQSLSFRAGLPGGLALTASAERSSNAYLYYDANYARRLRSNADLLRGSGTLSWKGFVGEGVVSAAAALGARTLGVPGSLDSPTPEARQRDLDASFSADYATDYFMSDISSLKANGYGRFAILEYSEADDDTADIHRSSRIGGDAHWSLLAGTSATINAGISTRYERLDSTVVKSADGSIPERIGSGVFFEPSIVLGSWTLAPALRWDWTSDFASGLSFCLGAAKTLNDEATFTVSASTAYRAPSFDDLYWPMSSGVEGNPNLRPETAYCADAGFSLKRGGRSFSASTFVRYSKDVILWQENDDGIWRPTNFGNAFYPGLELEYRSAAAPWTLSLSYGFLYSYILSGDLDFSDDKRVPGAPVNKLTATGAYASGPFKGSLICSYESLSYLTTANLAYQPAVFLLGTRLEWSLNDRLSFFCEGKNLLNERYESVKGYPMPGLSIELGFEYRTVEK
ncbi:MAG TPA: TonB-dependent receptor [Rectinemataceae bacterium]|nr:TonB-dependent receptor [Rectinemataceae bacterium]